MTMTMLCYYMLFIAIRYIYLAVFYLLFTCSYHVIILSEVNTLARHLSDTVQYLYAPLNVVK